MTTIHNDTINQIALVPPGDRLFHLSSDQPESVYEPKGLGLLRFLAYSAATLGEALRDLSANFDLVCPNGRLDIIQRNEFMVLRYCHAGGPRPEQMLVAILSFARAATGEAIVPAHVGLCRPAQGDAGELQRLFTPAQVGFGEAADTLTFRRGDQAQALRHSDPRLAELLRGSVARLRHASGASGWRPRFQEMVAAALPEGGASLDQMAARLAMSPRTLQRRLQDAGTSWRDELDRARRQRASELETLNGLTREAMAQRLGYSDARSLRRATKRWINE